MTVFGTRPEAIKVAPVIKELGARGVPQVVCVTGQHREMLDQMLALFELKPSYDLEIMEANQTLASITARSLQGLEQAFAETQPSIVLVQGDTNTAFTGALAAYYHRVAVAHIEAGLRTDDKYSPFPEEINRRLISQIADLNFAPTHLAASNLMRDGIPHERVHITGNTVVDALLWVSTLEREFAEPALGDLDLDGRRLLLVTTHRRENLGAGMRSIFEGLRTLVEDYDDLLVVLPVHLNPAIHDQVEEMLGGSRHILLTPPLGYADLAKLMRLSHLVLTDSGGIQEEAPALGKPVLVLRNTTERPEGIEAGTARLVGTDRGRILAAARELLDDPAAYQAMAHAVSPYGDGTAARQIVDLLIPWLDRAA
jgi:UDP-N-acetylglucosamine 2-epimerase (non-hydrolysing)